MPEPRINRLSVYLRRRFGGRVRKVPLDAGFTCPNRDGTLGTGGCAWCDPGGSGPDGPLRCLPWEEQLALGTRKAIEAGCQGTLAYFQAYTNTYAEAGILEAAFRRALSIRGVLGLAVGTRPDSLGDAVLDLLSDLSREAFLWVEVGMQTCRDETLSAMNRGHGHADTVRAVAALRERNLRVVLHLILGLPGETREDCTASLAEASRIGPWGMKFHPLMILKGSGLEEAWRRGAVTPPTREAYASLVADGLERLPPETVIHRMTGERPRGILLAPEWCFGKSQVLVCVESELERRGTRQGSRFRV